MTHILGRTAKPSCRGSRLNSNVRPHMEEWLTIITGSALIGALSAVLLSGRTAAWVSGGLPWLAFLTWVLYQEYAVPPPEYGGASMWPVAVLWAGTIAAAVGWGTYRLVRSVARSVLP